MDYVTMLDRLQEYSRQGVCPFHMPGHMRSKAVAPDINPYSIDITEIDGFDDLHHAQGCIKEASDRAAGLYGTVSTHMLVNGCTGGLLAAISACTLRGQGIIMARNCHKAVYNAVMINNLRPYYVWPSEYAGDAASQVIRPEDVEALLSEHDNIGCVVITSPTYEGYVSDVEGISRIAHRYKVPLIVDEAHGAHFLWDDMFPESAIRCGADIVIHGIHKTLPSLTQTALLHVCSDRIDEAVLGRYLSVYQSSSPSYILMGSIDNCVDYLIKYGKEDYEIYTQRLALCYDRLRELKRLNVLPYGTSRDASKIVVCTDKVTIDGRVCYNILRQKYNIQPEMASYNQVILMTSAWTSKEAYDILVEALTQIDREAVQVNEPEAVICKYPHNNYASSINDAMEASGETIALNDSEGSISKQMIYIYPPGIPIIVPGERINRQCIDILNDYRDRGYEICGLADSDTLSVTVVTE